MNKLILLNPNRTRVILTHTNNFLDHTGVISNFSNPKILVGITDISSEQAITIMDADTDAIFTAYGTGLNRVAYNVAAVLNNFDVYTNHIALRNSYINHIRSVGVTSPLHLPALHHLRATSPFRGIGPRHLRTISPLGLSPILRSPVSPRLSPILPWLPSLGRSSPLASPAAALLSPRMTYDSRGQPYYNGKKVVDVTNPVTGEQISVLPRGPRDNTYKYRKKYLKYKQKYIKLLKKLEKSA